MSSDSSESSAKNRSNSWRVVKMKKNSLLRTSSSGRLRRTSDLIVSHISAAPRRIFAALWSNRYFTPRGTLGSGL